MSRVECDPYPLQDRDWVDGADSTWEAAIYADICERYTAFSAAPMRDILKNGAVLARVSGGLSRSSRQLRKRLLGEAHYARDLIESTQHLYPEIADEVTSIYTRRAMPTYHPLPPKPGPGDGYPNDSSLNLKIIESIWGDIRRRNVVLCATSSLIYRGRLGYNHTTTVPKRLPGRTFSDES